MTEGNFVAGIMGNNLCEIIFNFGLVVQGILLKEKFTDGQR